MLGPSTCLGFQNLSPIARRWKTTGRRGIGHEPHFMRAGLLAMRFPRPEEPHTHPPHNKGALFCFESLMLALSKTAIPIPRRLHSLPSFALFRLLGALSLCFYSVGRLCDSGKGTKNLAWNWGFLSGTIWFLALAC